jgi:hypothetical protein
MPWRSALIGAVIRRNVSEHRSRSVRTTEYKQNECEEYEILPLNETSKSNYARWLHIDV